MHDVIVIGAGVVGLSAALAMHQRGFSTLVVDAGDLTALPVKNRRVYAINRASQSLLEALGAWDRLKEQSLSYYRHMHIWDASNGACLDFDSRLIAAPFLGAMVDEGLLKQVLLEEARHVGLQLLSNQTVTRVQTGALGVHVFSEHDQWDARLLSVADGALSKTRAMLGVNLTTWSYHQQAIVATVKTTKPHQATAYQVFNPEGPLAFLPLADEHQCSIVWSTSPQYAQGLMEKTDEAFSVALTKAFASKLGPVELIGARHQFPLHMRHVSAYVGQHWILMGDAAHTIHPLAGLGLNVGLADVSAFCELLDGRAGDLNSPRLLNAYQRSRKHAVWQVIAVMEGLKTLFMNPLPAIAMLRGIGLQWVNRLAFIKRYFIEQAAG